MESSFAARRRSRHAGSMCRTLTHAIIHAGLATRPVRFAGS